MKKYIFLFTAFIFLSLNSVYAESGQLTVLYSSNMGFSIHDKTSSGIRALTDKLQKEKGSLLVLDTGDFIYGTPYRFIADTEMTELKIMKRSGYDAFMIGNMDIMISQGRLAGMIKKANKIGGFPPFVIANVSREDKGEISALVKNNELRRYTVLNNGGHRIAVFGILSPTADPGFSMTSPLSLQSPVEAAKSVVEEIQKKENCDFIICLIQGGWNTGRQVNDEKKIARSVNGIDLIISSNNENFLKSPLTRNNCIIVNSSLDSNKLKSVSIRKTDENVKLLSENEYNLQDISEGTNLKNGSMSVSKKKIARVFKSIFDVDLFKPVIESEFDITRSGLNSNAGSLVADSMKWYYDKFGNGSVKSSLPTFSIISRAFIRTDLAVKKRNIFTAYDIFTFLPSGDKDDHLRGNSISAFEISGAEIKKLLEISLNEDIKYKGLVTMQVSGLQYTFNSNRIMYDKITDIRIKSLNGDSFIPVKTDEKSLYTCVSDFYTLTLIKAIEKHKIDSLTIVPKDFDGRPISDISSTLLKITGTGRYIAPWNAMLKYFESFSDLNGNGIPDMPASYSEVKRNIIKNESANPLDILTNSSWISWVTITIISIILVAFGILLKFALQKKR